MFSYIFQCFQKISSLFYIQNKVDLLEKELDLCKDIIQDLKLNLNKRFNTPINIFPTDGELKYPKDWTSYPIDYIYPEDNEHMVEPAEILEKNLNEEIPQFESLTEEVDKPIEKTQLDEIINQAVEDRISV